jgi:hypothetical protein
LIIEGQGKAPSDTVVTGSSKLNNRCFQIGGTPAAGVTVEFKDLAIEGGKAHGAGAVGGNGALGGGVLIDGGQVTLSDVMIAYNTAAGQSGSAGAPGKPGEAGGPGGHGGNA